MTAEQQRVYTPEERAEMVAAARGWKGTQAEFAALHGIAQSTVSKWLGAAERREYTGAERAEAVAALRAWPGTQTAFATARGIPQTTLSRWANDDRRVQRAHAQRSVVRREEAPTMLEVIPSGPPATVVPTQIASLVRLVMGGGVALVFDTLPPASWVAALAAELRPC
jgi:transposase-like protein